jgi:hypothetical protein
MQDRKNALKAQGCQIELNLSADNFKVNFNILGYRDSRILEFLFLTY